MESESTQIIVLRKTPYGESDLIVAGLSPDAGKLSLMLRGARKVGATKYPFADLYCELDVEYAPSDRSELFSVGELELAADFTGLAADRDKFTFAGHVGAFLLANSAPGVAAPLTYDALRNVLGCLAAGEGEAPPWDLVQMGVIVKLTYLYENGLLPGVAGGTAEEARALEIFENVINSGIDATPLPEFRPDYWKQLSAYLNRLIAGHNLATA